jgi:integrase
MAGSTKRVKTRFSGVVYRECETNGKPDKAYYIRIKDEAGKSVEKKIGKFSEGIRPEYCNIKRNELMTKLRFGESIKLKYTKKDKTNFCDLADAYFKTRRDTLTTIKDKNVQKNHLDSFFEDLDMDLLTRDHFIDLKNQKLKVLAPKSVNNLLTLLSSILNYAYKNELLKTDYTKYIQKESIDNARERFLSVEEIHKLYKAVKDNDMLYLFVKIALTTGARAGGVLNIQIKDIDFAHNFITIKDFKTNTTYAAFLNEDLKTLIIDYVKKYDIQTKLFDVWDSTIAKPLREIFTTLFNQGLKKEDRKNRVVIHTLRHTFASHLAINGTPIFTIQKLLNHKDIKMTMRYAKLSPDSGRDSVNSLNF